jgi:hypothetical protein
VSEEHDWVYNYFNYFTEVEEHFQQARGTSMFRLSSLDWALLGGWKDSGVPLEAVLRGIDAAFEKWRSRKVKTQMVNSLAFCAQAVMTEAQVMAGAVPSRAKESAPPFPIDDLRRFFAANSEALRGQENAAAFQEIAATLDRLSEEIESHYENLEELERRLTALEDKMVAAARVAQTDEQLLAARRELDLQLRPYRSKMSAEQLAMLEKQYLERRLLEESGLPRLSLFYLR